MENRLQMKMQEFEEHEEEHAIVLHHFGRLESHVEEKNVHVDDAGSQIRHLQDQLEASERQNLHDKETLEDELTAMRKLNDINRDLQKSVQDFEKYEHNETEFVSQLQEENLEMEMAISQLVEELEDQKQQYEQDMEEVGSVMLAAVETEVKQRTSQRPNDDETEGSGSASNVSKMGSKSAILGGRKGKRRATDLQGS